MQQIHFVIAALVVTLAGTVVGRADEFVGPFAGWADVRRDYGAAGDGATDDTAALQKALDALRREDRPSAVLFLPAGRYRITRTLELIRAAHEESKDISILGEDPETTTIVWDGPAGEAMWLVNPWYSRIGRLTLDGRGRAGTAIRHGTEFSTYNEFADMVFRDVPFGIEAGMKHGIAETTVARCRFLRCAKAGISIQNFNSLDWFIRDCLFEDCALGVTNTFGAGNFHVYSSLFRRSSQADISMGNTCYFSIRDNTSVGSKAFFIAHPMTACGNITLQGNTVLDCRDTAVQMGDMGPFLLLDNVIKSRTSPAVKVRPEAGFVAIGNTFTVPDAIEAGAGAIRLDNNVTAYDALQVDIPAPARALPKRNRPVIELAPTSTASEIQEAIDRAAAMHGQRPVVHLPAGTYAIDRTLVVPAGRDMQIVGDGCDTILRWSGQGSGPVLRLAGPSRATLREFFIDGTRTADGLRIDNCDQRGARVFMDQANISSATQTGLLVDGLENADVSLHDMNHGGCKLGVKVVGGSRQNAGQPTPGRVVIFSGSSSNNAISYAVANGGRLLVRDIWYESGQFPRFMQSGGSGTFTLHGAMVATAQQDGEPTLEFDDFKGNLTFLTSIFHSGSQSVPIVVKGAGDETNLLLLGVQMGLEDGYFINASPQARAALLQSAQYTQGGGGRPIPDVGTADPAFIRTMLAPTRTTHPTPPSPIAPGLTDLRLHRVGVSNARIGIHLVPTEETPR